MRTVSAIRLGRTAEEPGTKPGPLKVVLKSEDEYRCAFSHCHRPKCECFHVMKTWVLTIDSECATPPRNWIEFWLYSSASTNAKKKLLMESKNTLHHQTSTARCPFTTNPWFLTQINPAIIRTIKTIQIEVLHVKVNRILPPICLDYEV